LSELGHQQSVRLGEYWRGKGLTFDTVLTGTLRRHAQTWAGIARGAGYANAVLPWAGLNEYDSAAVIAAIHPQPLDKPDTPEGYRQHFRLLRAGLTRWMNGETRPQGMPSYADFLQGVRGALDHVRQHSEGNVLIVSSGGPIATAVGHVLGTPPEAVVELNMRIRNSAVTEFSFSPRRHSLLSYNTLPHLDHPDHAAWITYA
jgi:broad specificity phosphatase PhoE